MPLVFPVIERPHLNKLQEGHNCI